MSPAVSFIFPRPFLLPSFTASYLPTSFLTSEWLGEPSAVAHVVVDQSGLSSSDVASLSLSNHVSPSLPVPSSSECSCASLPASLLLVDCDVPFVASAEHSVCVFYNNIVKSHGVGIRSSCFSSDRSILFQLYCLHGIPVATSLSLEEIQHNILRHLLLSDCFHFAESNLSLPCGTRSDIQCAHLCQPFPSATDLSLSFVHCVLDDIKGDQKLNVHKISRLMLALTNASYTSDPFSTLTNVKWDTICLLNCV